LCGFMKCNMTFSLYMNSISANFALQHAIARA
jgi:hypothetical protein